MQYIYSFFKIGTLAVLLLFISQQTFAEDVNSKLIYAPEGITNLEVIVHNKSTNGSQLNLTFAFRITNNSSKNLNDLELNILNPSSGITVTDGSLNVGVLSAGDNVITTDTFTLAAILDQTGKSFKVDLAVAMFDDDIQEAVEDEALIEIHIE